MKVCSIGKFATKYLLGYKHCQVCGSSVYLETEDVKSDPYGKEGPRFYFICAVCKVENQIRVPEDVEVE